MFRQYYVCPVSNYQNFLSQERRLIKPSQRLIKQQGSHYLQMLINKRCEEILRKVGLQFSSRSADRRYQASKQMINDFLDGISNENLEANPYSNDWEVLSP